LNHSQSVDFGFNQQWKKDAATGVWRRAGEYESACHVLGIHLCLPVSQQTSEAHLTTILLNLNLIIQRRAFSCIAMLEQLDE
jgi:hypothetical protein